jgi:Ras-related protein Rab-11A
MAYGIKICLLGDGGVGKTSIRQRFLGQGFNSTYVETIGADFSKKIVFIDETELILQIWDLAGQSRYDSVRSLYYTGVRGALIVYDLSRPTSLENVPKWIEELLNHTFQAIPIVLIGNKSDLLYELDDKTKESVRKMVTEIKKKLRANTSVAVHSIETSAKTGENINRAFTLLGKSLLRDILKK